MSNLSELKRIAEEGGADVSNVKCNEEALALIGGSGSGSDEYDLVFRTSTVNLGAVTAENTELESGTFADAYAKALTGKKLSIRFYGYATDDNDGLYTCDYNISSVYADRGYNDHIRFYLTGGYQAQGTVYGSTYAAATSGGSPTVKKFGVMGYSPIWVSFSESGITMNRIAQ